MPVIPTNQTPEQLRSVELGGDPRVLLTVRTTNLAAAILHSEMCPFDLTVDLSLSFCTLSADRRARPPFVFIFDSHRGVEA